MVFGREIRTPYQSFTLPRLDSQQAESLSMRQRVESAKVTAEIVKENILQSYRKADKYFNRKAKPRVFNVGDKVWLLTEKTPKGYMTKLYPRMRGPYTIIEILPHNSCLLMDVLTGHCLRNPVHFNRLCLARLEQDHLQPEVLDKPEATGTPPSGSGDPTWCEIELIIKRKRDKTGRNWLYEVTFKGHADKVWLPARDISEASLREFYVAHRQKRRRKRT